jgi:hypothetical protein
VHAVLMTCRGKTKKVASKRGDDDLFIIERVIGCVRPVWCRDGVHTHAFRSRKKVGQRVNGSRIYEYLVKWENWEMYDATWWVTNTTMIHYPLFIIHYPRLPSPS